MQNIYDVIIVGGGPAGAASGVYAARKKLKALLIADNFGGQSVVSDSIENWIGTVNISGFELAQKLEEHVKAQEGIEINLGEKAIKINKDDCGFKVETDKKKEYFTKSLVIALGGRHRRLGIPGEDKFEGKGVSFCSTCDAPLFKDKKVAVIGGGNSGLEAVVDLFSYAKEIFLIISSEQPKGDPTTLDQVKSSDKVTIINNANTKEILGDNFVTGIKYDDTKSNKENELSVEGIFVEIGTIPNSDFVKDLVKTNKFGEIIVDYKTGETSMPGIFAAGDITDELYKQNNIAVGDGIRATLSAYNYVLNIKKRSPADGCK